jgi:hypothetical protein
MELSKIRLEKSNKERVTNCNLIIWAAYPPSVPFFVWLRHTKKSTQFGLWNRANKNTQCIKLGL